MKAKAKAKAALDVGARRGARPGDVVLKEPKSTPIAYAFAA